MTDAGDPLFELDEATVIRRGVPALDRVTVSVRLGEHTAILGPNGSGKSTLIKLLSGELYPVAHGDGRPTVRVFGRSRWNLVDLRGRLGLVSADLQLRLTSGSSMGRITAREAVLTGFFSSEVIFFHHRVETWMQSSATTALERMGVGGLADRPMNCMSTGEVRRVLIARALVHAPEALILDEPTTGLDVVARHDLLTHIRRLAREGTSVVLVTHDIEEVVPEIDRVILLRSGRIMADGTPEEVLTSEQFGATYGAAVAVERIDHHFEMRLDRAVDRASTS